MSRVIRSATPADLGALQQIESACFSPNDSALSPRQMRYHLARNPLLVAEADSRVVGYALLLLSPKRTRLYSLAILPAFRGQGLAKALMKSCESETCRLGRSRISLEVRPENVDAITLYAKMGFETELLLPSYYPDGSAAQRMIKILHSTAKES